MLHIARAQKAVFFQTVTARCYAALFPRCATAAYRGVPGHAQKYSVRPNVE
jgi:hypothetical protein